MVMRERIPTLRVIIIALLLTAAFSAQAEDRRGKYEILGLGKSTCREYSIVRNPNPYDNGAVPDKEYIAWLQGYLSAFDTWIGDTYSIRGQDTVAQLRDWLVAYCAQNPDITFEKAVAALVALHFRNRIR
jgi:hypothetical protein